MREQLYESENFLESDAVPGIEITPGFRLQPLLSGNKLSLCVMTFNKGGALPEHVHPHEQAGYVLSGALELTVDGKRVIAPARSAYLVRSNVPYAARALDQSSVVKAFSGTTPFSSPGGLKPPGEITSPARLEAREQTDGRYPIVVDSADVPELEVVSGFWRQTLIYGNDLMLVLSRFSKAAPLPEHNHPHEQAGYVLSGALELNVAGRTRITRAGCSSFMYSNQLHSARALEDSLALDAFSPPRLDYLVGA